MTPDPERDRKDAALRAKAVAAIVVIGTGAGLIAVGILIGAMLFR
jgi:hypothetical protein